jgi:hypothetical protein
MATKRRPTASASSRAIVVLPVPGGPQRMIELSLPAATMPADRAFGSGEMLLADDIVQLRGRSRSASGLGSSIPRSLCSTI